MEKNSINNKDREILRLLSENGRMTYSEIGEQIGLSRTAVKNRVVALEEKGIIAGYKAVINTFESMETTTFIVNVETSPEAFESVKKAFEEAGETVMLLQTTGKCHLTGICLSKDMKTMRSFINNMYKANEGISYINANAVMDVVKGSIVPI